MKPGKKILVIWFFSKCIIRAVAGLFIYFWASFFLIIILGVMGYEVESGLLWSKNSFLIALIAIFIVLIMYYNHLLDTYTYYITDRRCVFRGGILQRIERSVPYHKITDVEISQNIVERILKISSLRIYTPGTASMRKSLFGWKHGPEIEFVGLEDSETPANTVNEALKAYKATGE